MGILMVSIAGAIILGFIIWAWKMDEWIIVVGGAFAAVAVIFICLGFTEEPQKPSEYLNSAEISTGKIYFNDFSQQDNVITIDNYAAGGKIHWSDFKNYDVMNETLTIQLTDNLNRFEYKEIKTGKVFNKRIATQ